MSEDKKYTAKITVPKYTPKKDKAPKLEELYDDSEYRALLSKLEKVNVKVPIKEFLKLSSSRFIKFKYNKIAEYYAHATPEVKELMEDLLLVLVDFDKALEADVVGFTTPEEEEACQGTLLY